MNYLSKKLVGASLLLVLLGSCSDMGEPEILLPQMEIDPTSIDFATITIGSPQIREVQITNSGEGELSGSLSLTQMDGAYTLQPQGSFMILPGDTLIAEVTFTPSTEQTFSAEINITSDDLNNPAVSIALTGVGTALPVPVLSLSSNSLDFGTILSNASNQLQLTLSSTGNDTLRISSIDLDLTEYTADVIVPLELIPGATQDVTVTFTPGAEGTFSGNMTITSNSSSSPDVVSLAGVAETAVSYASDVQTVFNTSCAGCHGSNGGLNLTSYANLMAGTSSNGPVVTAGDGANSLIVQRINGSVGSLMPAGGPSLSATTIATIEKWIDQGAHNN